MICASGIKDNTSAFQAEDSGSNPTLALQDYQFNICSEVKDFIAKHHYTHSMSGVQYRFAFAAFHKEEMHGAAVFGQTAMPETWRRYARAKEELIELRRLVFVDRAPRNIESKFIGWCLRWLKANTDIKIVLSYADPFYGHAGTIYKAANFQKRGTTASSRVIDWKGKIRHSKSLQAGRKTEIRPYSFLIREALKTGEAKYITRPGKNIYTYCLR